MDLLPPRVLTRLVDGNVCAYDLAAETSGVLSPARVFRPRPGDEVVGHAVAADLQRAVYTTLDAAVCVRSDGTEAWRSAFEPPSTEALGHRPSCAFSLDGSVIWIYRPDSMAGRDGCDQWVVLDAATGAGLAGEELDTAGHGGTHFPHPNGEHVLLDVGEGQDGTSVFRGRLSPGELELFRYPWNDRCLVALAPDGDGFMTVDHEQEDVAFHAYPDGDVTLRLPVEAFGHDPDDCFVEWGGGYLTPDTAIVTVGGETEDEQEWFRAYRVDLRSGQVGAEFDGQAEEIHDLELLGDGSWLTTDHSGHPVRRR